MNFKFLKYSLLLIFILFSLFVIYNLPSTTKAVSESDCLNKSVSELSQSEMDECINVILPRIAAAYAPAQEQNKANLAGLKKQIDSLNVRINSISKELVVKESNIQEREKDSSYAQKILNQKAVNQYITSRLYDPITALISSVNVIDVFKTIKITEMVAEEDRKTIEKYSEEINNLKNDKESLEKNKISLASLQKKVSGDAKFLEAEVGKVDTFLSALSAKQQEIINLRSGNFIASIGDGTLASTGVSSRSHFLSSAPSGYYAVFSFGAYTHRNGMSQYGALGRVKNGKSAEDVLRYYYPGVNLTQVNTNVTIIVNGKNTYGQVFNNEPYQLEEYLKHIYEMPGSWPKEVLKAQAIAARSFAYGKSTICPGQSCQEFKREENTDNWKNAVKETEGIIMTGGSGSYQYSSTTGGWMNTTGWDTTDGQGGTNFLEKTYETLGGSPWTYLAWYVDIFGEYGSKGGTCGKSNPWLSPEEMADIVNAHLVLTKGTGEEQSRISPVTTGCWPGNPYSISELRSVASKYGGIETATTSPSVLLGNGTTNSVTINSIQMSGAEFKRAFALRAPGFIRIPQKGFAFFNIEKK
ncbi:MAG: SpoIID/LytB domain-containing protein [bacterium]|nr:MAG: SpoIID/LytB domain-containing protein [bacterium]